MQKTQQAEVNDLFEAITNAGDRRFVLGILRKVAARQVPQKPAFRLILGGLPTDIDGALFRDFG